MHSKFNYYWLLLIFPLFFISWYFVSHRKNAPARFLPVYGPKKALKINDTTYHYVPAFRFVDQLNQIVDTTVVKDHIYIAEYFFTTCQSICPIMNNNLEKVHKIFKDRSDFLILSHTVDPENDSVSVLNDYARLHGVTDNKKWKFVTGNKDELYRLARKGYLLNAQEGNGGAEDFIHTQNFALVDKKRHLRGFYDGTDSLEIERMISDINLLIKEYEYGNKTGS